MGHAKDSLGVAHTGLVSAAVCCRLRILMDDRPPMIVGSAGLTGRPPVRPAETEPLEYDDEGALIVPETRAMGKAMPPNCLRVWSSPLPDDRGGGCSISQPCAGRQRDGGCLVDIVREAVAQDADWSFEVVHEGDVAWWDYTGPPLSSTRSDEEDAEPAPSFSCPHCGKVNKQDLANFHYWCEQCGKNARDVVA